ncbi:hypothetical protein KSS87_002332 [Heliosperma pusillum]|nr:hypothetical protein KSS87_002332 [Heliosperma pusillum]
MATPKPQRSPEEVEDIILRKIFLVSLMDSSSDSIDPRVIYLEQTAAEILSEGKQLRLCRDLMERVLIDRLSNPFPGAQPPFYYLVGCHCRAFDEGKKIINIKDNHLRSEMENVVFQSKKLSVSYCRIHLGNPDIFPDFNANASSSRNVSPLLPIVFSQVGGASIDGFGSSSSGSVGEVKCAPGFLDDLFMDADFDSLEPIFKNLYDNLREKVVRESALGNFQLPLRALIYLVRIPAGAKSLVTHKWWMPPGSFLNGRAMEVASILGPFFHISALPDTSLFKSQPDVGQQCFSEASTRRPADLLSSFTTIKTVMNNLYDGLHEVIHHLLKKTNTREKVLEFLGAVINSNASRAALQVDPLTCASSGMELTALHASSEEVSTYVSDLNARRSADIMGNNFGHNRLSLSQASSSSNSQGGPPPVQNYISANYVKYPFICECFFMTARVLNLGLLKALSDFKHLVQDISRCEDNLATFKALLEQGPSRQLEMDIARLEKEMESFSQEKLCYEAQILRDGGFIQNALSFYRLVLIWLARLVGGFKLPLPAKCPMEFACMPEHFVEDAMDLLIFASRIPKALDGVILDDFMNFIIMFMASPEYIRNPYLRAKMVEVLN